MIEKIKQTTHLVIDTETNGLFPYLGDKPFLIVFGTDEWQDHVWEKDLTDELRDAIANHPKIIGHNLKFDMHMLSRVGIELKGELYDTKTMARLVDNQRISYEMAALAPEVGEKKDSSVEDYIKKNKLYAISDKGGKPYKRPCYERVPEEIILPYALQDVRVTYKLFKKYAAKILELSKLEVSKTPLLELFRNEQKLLKVVYNLEKRGARLDSKFLAEADVFYTKREKELLTQLELMAPGFTNSGKFLASYFKKAFNIDLPKTKKGNDKVDEDSLLELKNEHPECEAFVNALLDFRDVSKALHTYIKPYLFFSDENSILHFSLDPAGTYTGRFSSKEPNVQNVPKEARGPYPIKMAFVPRDGYMLFEIDYSAQEFRLALHFAKDVELGGRVANGDDPHQATADMTGLGRREAKTVTFASIYGAGPKRIAAQLNVSTEKGREFLNLYMSKLPKIRQLINTAVNRAKARGFIQNPYGRILRFQRDFSYKAPNHLIQSTGSDICKRALIDVHEFLEDKKSKILLQVHDAILFEVHESELEIVEEIVNIMKSSKVFESSICPMDCSVEWSRESWAKMQKGDFLGGKEARDKFQGKSTESDQGTRDYVGSQSPASNHIRDTGYSALL